MRKVGIFVHPRFRAAHDLGRELERFLQGQVESVWLTTAWDSRARELVHGTELLVCIGGDGTMLWAARAVIPYRVPIMGISMGRLAFLAEVQPGEAVEKLRQVLAGQGRVEERTVLQASLGGQTYYGLNDAVVGRARLGRPIYVQTHIDGEAVALYRADAVIVATATGSTAYSLSAGGPLLHPEARELVLTPVCPHLAAARSLVLHPDAVVCLTVRGEHTASFSVDGQEDLPLAPGESVEVRRSPYVACFLRLSPPQRDYLFVSHRLGWHPGNTDPDRPLGSTSRQEEDLDGQ
jgi:NAD+ kinase